MSVNEKEGKLERLAASQSRTTASYPNNYTNTSRWTNSGYSWGGNSTYGHRAEEKGAAAEPVPLFILKSPPSELKELEMLWTLALECQRPEVVPRVIDFLIKAHLSFP